MEHYGKIQTKLKPNMFGKQYSRENGRLPDIFRGEAPKSIRSDKVKEKVTDKFDSDDKSKSMISKLKKIQLYSVVSSDIDTARIKISKLMNDVPLGFDERNEIDDIMYNLSLHTPQKAVEVFTK